MKKKRFVILKKAENLKETQKEELQQLMNNNEGMYRAYLLKEQILLIFDDKKSTFDQIKALAALAGKGICCSHCLCIERRAGYCLRPKRCTIGCEGGRQCSARRNFQEQSHRRQKEREQ